MRAMEPAIEGIDHRLNGSIGNWIFHLGNHLVTWEKRDGRWQYAAKSTTRESPPVEQTR